MCGDLLHVRYAGAIALTTFGSCRIARAPAGAGDIVDASAQATDLAQQAQTIDGIAGSESSTCKLPRIGLRDTRAQARPVAEVSMTDVIDNLVGRALDGENGISDPNNWKLHPNTRPLYSIRPSCPWNAQQHDAAALGGLLGGAERTDLRQLQDHVGGRRQGAYPHAAANSGSAGGHWPTTLNGD